MEFAEWQCMFAKEGWHPGFARLRHAQLLAATYTGPAKPRNGAGHRASDFMPADPWAPPPAPPTAATLAAQVEWINSQLEQ